MSIGEMVRNILSFKCTPVTQNMKPVMPWLRYSRKFEFSTQKPRVCCLSTRPEYSVMCLVDTFFLKPALTSYVTT